MQLLRAAGAAWLIALLCLMWRPARAQDAAADSLLGPRWESDILAKLAATQAGYSNWTKGGVNSLAFSTGLEGIFERESPSWNQKHDFRLAYGLVKQDTLEFRKANDEISLNSSLQYRGSGFFRLFNPTVALQTRTQFWAGYNYKNNPFDDDREPPVKVSDFFSPATLTQSLGLTVDPAEWFTQRVGVGAKQTVVVIEDFRSLYGVEESSAVHVEVGIESRSQLEREVFENVLLKSSLGLFAAFNKPEVPDLIWENIVAMKVNSWLTVNLAVDALYDRDISDLLQLKEVLSLGLSFVLI